MFWAKAKTPAIVSAVILLAAAVATIAVKRAPLVDTSMISPEARMEAIKSFIANPPFVSLVKFEDPTPEEAEFIRTNKPASGNAFGPYPYKIGFFRNFLVFFNWSF
jgi:hypothetical protein